MFALSSTYTYHFYRNPCDMRKSFNGLSGLVRNELGTILVDKYMDHLPLYRQLQRFKKENIPIASSTLEGWTKQSRDILDILYQHLLEDSKAKGYIQADETPIKVIDKNKKGTTHQGYTGCTIAL